jgi:NDP-sugar pyrophosphorylase family protein
MPPLTAIILCGGRGDRLRPITDAVPKPLVPLNGRPILGHLLTYLIKSNVSRFVLCVGYKAELVQAFVAENFSSELNVICVNSGDVSITDRLIDAARQVEGRAVICYGDTLANIDLDALEKAHEVSGALATLSVYPLHSPFGIVDFAPNRQISVFKEKPILPYWINIGFLLCEQKALDYLQPGTDMPAFLTSLSDAGVLFAFEHHGRHLTVNSEHDRATAEAQMVEFYTLADR